MDLELAIQIIEIVVGVIAILLLGALLGNKIGGWKLLTICGILVAVLVVAFAINAAVVYAIK